MLSFANLTLRVAGRALMEGASAQIATGQRVGLVGRNGAGKSTLLDAILGRMEPDQGSVTINRGVRIGHLAQEAPGGAETPLETVLAADAERARLMAESESTEDVDRLVEIATRLEDIDAYAAPSRAATILAGLGFDEAMQNRPLSSYSGGWRMRVALAAVLFAGPDLLLLDEPTNHLDLEATLWLEGHLKAYPKTLLVVSHDRQILNAVCTHILHLDQRKLTLYTGGYDGFQKLRAERIAQTQAAAVKIEAKRQHMQAFVDRFRAQATKARQAQSRLKALARLAPTAVMVEDPSVTLQFPQPGKLSPPLLTVDRASVGYSPGKPILRDVDLRLDPEDRIALLGANGNGKSTLAKLFAGRLQPLTGHTSRSAKLTAGFFAQHQIEDMAPEQSAFDHMAELMPGAKPEAVRARLGRFGFGQEKAFVKVRDLSGGERARLNFALITHNAPSMLILDEPTNHLDIEAREALAEAINDFSGAVVLISHDWHLLELTVDRLWLVADGRVSPFDGDLEDYRRHILSKRNGEGRSERGGGKPAKLDKSARRALEPLLRAARESEDALKALGAERERVERELARPETHRERGRAAEYARSRAVLDRRIALAEEAWLAAEDALERARAAA